MRIYPTPMVLAFALIATFSIHAQPRTGRVSTSAPARLKPDARLQPLSTLPPGTPVTILKEEGGWYQITFHDQQWGQRTGYMRVEHVVTAAAPAPPLARIANEPAPRIESTEPVASTPESARAAVAAKPSASTAVPNSAGESPTAAAGPASSDAPVLGASGLTAPRTPGRLDDRAVADSIAMGLKQRGRTQGLRLMDSAQQFMAAMGSTGGATASNGFRVQVYTPLAWIRQLASDAAKEYRPFSAADLNDDSLAPVLRVIAFPDTPNTVTAKGMAGTSSVQHVVLRDEQRRIVIQPTFKEPFTEEVANAMGGKATFVGLQSQFPLDALRELRGAKGDREFFITVIGASNEEKNFRVKKKHFDDLPMQ